MNLQGFKRLFKNDHLGRAFVHAEHTFKQTMVASPSQNTCFSKDGAAVISSVAPGSDLWDLAASCGTWQRSVGRGSVLWDLAASCGTGVCTFLRFL